jgi:hypothetical protein
MALIAIMDYEVRALPSDQSIVSRENISCFRQLGSDQDILYFSAIYGLFEQVCRTKSRQHLHLIYNKLHEISSRVDQSLRPPFDFLRNVVVQAGEGLTSVQDCNTLIRFSNFRNTLKAFLKEVLVSEGLTFSPNLQRDDMNVLPAICRVFQVEIAIYWMVYLSPDYERTEIFSSSPGLTINIYQTQIGGVINTGLLYFQEFIEADAGSLANYTAFPFTCMPGPGTPRRFIERCNSSPFVQRYSKGPLYTGFNSAESTNFRPSTSPGVPPQAYPPDPRAFQTAPPQAYADPRAFHTEPPRTYFPDTRTPPPSYPADPRQAQPASPNQCQVCNNVVHPSAIYTPCPNQCIVCNQCMVTVGLPSATCPKCRNRMLSQVEIQLIQILGVSIGIR